MATDNPAEAGRGADDGRRGGARSARRGEEDALRGLTAAGSSKVGVDKAMRARDVSRAPTDPRPGEVDR